MKKLEDMWTTSFMLPEHREEIQIDRRRAKILNKPDLDEQEVEKINEVIGQSIRTKCLITLFVYNFIEYRQVLGKVSGYDNQYKQVQIAIHDEGGGFLGEKEWIKLNDIVKGEVKEFKEWNNGEIDW